MKHYNIVIAFLLFFLGLDVCAQDQNPTSSRKRVAVVLSGGGAKGMAHIGALKVFEKAGIPIDIITGTSMGSIVGGLYAIGYDAATLDSLVRSQNWAFLLSDMKDESKLSLEDRRRANTYIIQKEFSANPNVSEAGLITGRNLAVLFDELVGEYGDSINFSSLPIPYACVATNIIDNTEYIFHRGRLAQAMRASMAIPGAFSPVKLYDKVLVDGGLRNNYPVDVAREMGADIVIGVTLQGDGKTADELKTTVDILSQLVDVNCKNKFEENIANSDLHMRVNTKGYSAASFTTSAIDTLIRRGEEEAMRHWDELMALKKEIGIDDSFTPRKQIPPRPAQEKYKTYQGRNLVGGLAVRFDTEERVAMQANVQVPLKTKMPTNVEATLRLGKRIMGRLDLSQFMENKMDENTIPMFMGRLSYIYRRNELNIYDHGKKNHNVTYDQHTLDLELLNFNVRHFNVEFGAIYDYYDFRSILVAYNVDNPGEDLEDTHFYRYYARVNYNSEDKWNFPTRGARFQARYAYYSDNLSEIKGHAGMSAVSAMWRMSFLLGHKLTIQPMTYGRLLFGPQQPVPLRNMIGGDWFGHYSYQQMPFAGVGYMEFTNSHFIAAQLQAQQQLGNKHYILLKLAAAQHADKFSKLLDQKTTFGVQGVYCFNSLLGPVGAALGYSNLTKRVNFYVNFGYEF
ncbi:MAG: patatin-like phospholipase family protein [Prevotella sp.]|nr:patatin-like phospholipase family protein [Prevotella sp.]